MFLTDGFDAFNIMTNLSRYSSLCTCNHCPSKIHSLYQFASIASSICCSWGCWIKFIWKTKLYWYLMLFSINMMPKSFIVLRIILPFWPICCSLLVKPLVYQFFSKAANSKSGSLFIGSTTHDSPLEAVLVREVVLQHICALYKKELT